MGTTEVTRIASTKAKRARYSSQIESKESDLDHRTWNSRKYIKKNIYLVQIVSTLSQ